jgi:intein/homing endonuclease
MCEVVTARGRKFSATANHPMLTRRGWVGAGSLRVGDELICEEFCHIYNWEAGGPAFLSGVTCRTVRG